MSDPVPGGSRHIGSLSNDDGAGFGFTRLERNVMDMQNLNKFLFNDSLGIIINIDISGDFTDFIRCRIADINSDPE